MKTLFFVWGREPRLPACLRPPPSSSSCRRAVLWGCGIPASTRAASWLTILYASQTLSAVVLWTPPGPSSGSSGGPFRRTVCQYASYCHGDDVRTKIPCPVKPANEDHTAGGLAKREYGLESPRSTLRRSQRPSEDCAVKITFWHNW